MITLIHNGMDVSNHFDEASAFLRINQILNEYAHLQPKLLYDTRVGNMRLLGYQYYTLYCELFVIKYD